MGDRAYGIFNNSERFDKFGRLKIGNRLIKADGTDTAMATDDEKKDNVTKTTTDFISVVKDISVKTQLVVSQYDDEGNLCHKTYLLGSLVTITTNENDLMVQRTGYLNKIQDTTLTLGKQLMWLSSILSIKEFTI